MKDYREYVRGEFKKNARNVSRNDFGHIEYLLRQGEKKLEQISGPSVTRINVPRSAGN